MMDVASPSYLWMEVADSIKLTGLDTKWKVADGADLVSRLQNLSLIESATLADSISRWWPAVGEGDNTRDQYKLLDKCMYSMVSN